MPLYLKLDIASTGSVHIWRSKKADPLAWGKSVTSAPSAKAALRKLAGMLPLPVLQDGQSKEEPK